MVPERGRCSSPYKSISHFSVETAVNFDMDAEMKIYISGKMIPIEREFKGGTDVLGVQKTPTRFTVRLSYFAMLWEFIDGA